MGSEMCIRDRSTNDEDTEIKISQTKFQSDSAQNLDAEEIWQEDDDVDWDKQRELVQIDNVEWEETIDLD